MKKIKSQLTRKKELILTGNKIFLRAIKISDATNEYVKWLNSKEINQFLESRFIKHSLKSLKEYLKKIIKDPNSILIAIIDKKTLKHIGNIKMGPIDWNHKFTEMGIIIGDKNFWGKGYATESILRVSDYGFKKLKLRKISAGAYSNNIGSIRAFMKAGFHEDCRKRQHYNFNGEYVDGVILAKINTNSKLKMK